MHRVRADERSQSSTTGAAESPGGRPGPAKRGSDSRGLLPASAPPKMVACTCCGQAKPETELICPHCKYQPWSNIIQGIIGAGALSACFAGAAQFWFKS